MKPLILALLLALTAITAAVQETDSRFKSFRNSKRFSINYDKFKDESYVRVGPFSLGGEAKNRVAFGLYLTASFRYKGASLNEPIDNFVLWFQASGRKWQFLKARHGYALIDGERVNLGEGKWTGDVKQGTFESLGFVLSADLFHKLGKAASVELRIGDVEITLKDEHKEAFRDLLSLSK